jgi:predicted transposase YdaD
LDRIFEEAGLVAKWEARGEARGLAQGLTQGEEKKAREIAKNLLENGFSAEQTAKLSGLDIMKVKALLP